MTDHFITLTEMWQDGKYVEVGDFIRDSGWLPREIAEFCAYFDRLSWVLGIYAQKISDPEFAALVSVLSDD